MAVFIDTHCHLDAPEFGAQAAQVHARSRRAGVALCLIPSVAPSNFETVRALAHAQQDAYALGIHPLCTAEAGEAAFDVLQAALDLHGDDPRLVAVGEIGLDYFVPELDGPTQERLFRRQLQMAWQRQLPVLLHVRRSVDKVLRQLREVGGGRPWRGIAHAFVGSRQQAEECLGLGLKLGLGGAMTFERATRLRELATRLPLESFVLETDAPDIPPSWLYQTREAREAGSPQGRNEPAEVPRIAQVLAELRGLTVEVVADATTRNALAAVPRLAALMPARDAGLAELSDAADVPP
ncbi:TatD family hydrolase [uncultured Pseudacidovorax sp.]|uniref:TatD family hydrolase n=1 Tax=uncultured Pseudacidovorax sp. TaxID=679313 RepID=UPI0025FEA110|nr:TatD family hydrolase [uncultured Pseudacidovorax sp.]